MKKLVYSYIRFSTPEQSKGHSLQRQLDYARDYASKHGLPLDERLSMRDEGLSAYHQTNIKKGALGAFLKAVEDKIIPSGSVLIVEALDRLSRAEPIQSQALLSQIINGGITVVTASDNKVYNRETLKTNPMDLVYSLLVMIRGHEESSTKSSRVKASIRKQVNEWIETGKGSVVRVGSDPYWCQMRSDKSGFDLINDRADTVRYIYKLYMDGWGTYKISEHLNETAAPFNGKLWYQKYVAGIIKSRCLIGERFFNLDEKEIIIKNYYPPVLSNDEFAMLQMQRANRGTTKSQGRIPSIYTGMKIAFCALCGKSLVSQNHTGQIRADGTLADGNRRVRCAGGHLGNNCRNAQSTQAVIIERALLEFCHDRMELSSLVGNGTEITEKRVKLNSKRGELTVTEQQIEKLADAFLTMDNPPVSLLDRLRSLETSKKELSDEITILETELTALESALRGDVVEEWQQVTQNVYALDEEARLKVRQLVKRTFAKIEINLHDEIKPEDCDPIPCVKLILHFYNGQSRILMINKETGKPAVNFNATRPEWLQQTA